MSRYATSLACALVLAAVAAFALRGDAQAKGQPVLDTDFLIKAINDTHAEMKYCELADAHAASDKVKAFAGKLAKEHKSMLQNLDRFVSDRKLAVVAGADKASRDEADRLSKLQGANFDKAFLQRIIDDHEKTIQMFETQAKQGKDAGLKAFANETLPRLREHLQEAKALAGQPK
jgi:putative membrane protein